jgi:N-acetylglucosaminyldiphosphoundecaprenol N-acetyl-beta-D-mannosaminyltransferase
MTSKKTVKQAKILKVRVDSTSVAQVLRQVQANIAKKKKFYIVTPNPEHILKANEYEEFREIINSADISIPDGIGVVAAYKFNSLPNPRDRLKRIITLFAQGLGVGFSVLFDRDWLMQDMQVIRGRDLFMELITLANKKKWKAYLLGGWEKVAQRTQAELSKNYKNLKIESGTGPILNDQGIPINRKEKTHEKKIVEKISKFKPQLLFIGLSAPKQEFWLKRNFDKLDFGGAMVLGGTFDYVSGQTKLPPKWVADMGLEWLWRLFTGSQKTERIVRAFPQFPWEVFMAKLKRN